MVGLELGSIPAMRQLRSPSSRQRPPLTAWVWGVESLWPKPEPFPAVYSTLAPQAIADFVAEHYPIDAPQACHFWHRGLSDVYLLETRAESYIFRVSHRHWRSSAEIKFELDWLAFLAQRGLPVSPPLPSGAGQIHSTLNASEGSRYGALFPSAPGSVAIGDLNITQAWILGETVAHLHRESQSFASEGRRSALTTFHLVDDSLRTLAPFLHAQPEDWGYLTATSLQIKAKLRHLPTEPPYWSVCWGDPHSGNVHFTADNRPTLFDFDQCGAGWRAFDVAKFLQVALQTGLCRSVRDAFLKGYQSVSPLEAVELDALRALTQAAYLWSWSIQVNTLKWNDYSRLGGNYFSQRLCRLKQLGSRDCQLF